jgi:hypothetical protein
MLEEFGAGDVGLPGMAGAFGDGEGDGVAAVGDEKDKVQ